MLERQCLLLPLSLGFGALLAGCAPQAESAAPSKGNATTSGASGSVSSATVVPEPPPPADGCKGVNRLLPARVRRLTRLELENTLTALLGEEAGALATELEADSSATRFSTGADRGASSAYVAGVNRLAGLAAKLLDPSRETRGLDPGCATDEASGAECARVFIQSFGGRAWRRPIPDSQASELMTVYRAGRLAVEADADEPSRHRAGLEYVVRAVLQASSFLFRTELGPEGADVSAGTVPLTAQEAAAALSYGLLASPPDEELSAWANSGASPTLEALVQQGRRLLDANPTRYARQAELFVREWLGIDLSSAAWRKDPARYPEATPELRTALDRETTLLLRDWASTSSLTQLLTAPRGYVSRANAWLYGVPEDSPLFVDGAPQFTPIDLDPSVRAGVLTLPSLMGSWARPGESSPVQRGVNVMRKLLCREPPPVPPLVPPLPTVDQAAPRTTRERFEQHVASPGCAACHQAFDPMGFPFEQYDTVGAYRELENGLPVDARGGFIDRNGALTGVDNAVALVALLAQSADVHGCVVRQVHRFTSGRREREEDACVLSADTTTFAEDGFDVRELLLRQIARQASSPRTTIEEP